MNSLRYYSGSRPFPSLIPTHMTASTPPAVRPSELLYPDLDAELALTRRMLAVVPDGQNDWKPHEKSASLGGLATHIASLPGFASTIFSTMELDWATFKYVPPVANTTAERLALFDERAAAMSAQVKGADWPALAEHWVMRAGDKVMMDEPKGKLLRTMGLSHIAHHRAQLGVYLRLLDVPIPGTYGPSADEKMG